ncbi:MAG: hypothetical protein LWX83_18180 [Anaerolineae bacterium]|nr:hypothetical protein [Anaerolineae bacterium]
MPFLSGFNWPLLLLRFLLTSVTILFLFGICLFVLILLQRWLKIKDEHVHQISILNDGNVTSYYRLIVESPEKALKFLISMYDIPLGEINLPAQPEEDVLPDTNPAVSQPITITKPQTISSLNNKPKTPDKSTPEHQDALKKANQTGKAVAEKSGALASFLGTLGSLIPGSAGKALKEQAEKARAVQSNTNKTMQMPEDAQTKVKSLQKDSSKLGAGNKEAPKDIPKPNEKGKNIAAKTNTDPQVKQQVQVEQANTQTAGIVHAQPILKGPYCVQTDAVTPGEEINLTLKVTSKSNRLPEGSFLYTIKSRQIPVEKLDQEAPLVISQGLVHFKPVASWRYWLPYYLNGTVIMVGLLAVIYFLTLIWL